MNLVSKVLLSLTRVNKMGALVGLMWKPIATLTN